MARKCVRLSQAGAQERDAAWEWLAESASCGADPAAAGPSVDAAWHLLRHLLERTEKDRESVCHRAVVVRLLSLGQDMPAWLSASYKKVI